MTQEKTTEKKKGSFDIWECNTCGRFERNVKSLSTPKCPKCHTKKIRYCGQVSR